MSVLDNYLNKEINFLDAKRELILCYSSEPRFLKLFISERWKHPNDKECFLVLKKYFDLIFKGTCLKFEFEFETFIKRNFSSTKLNQMTRTYLIDYFKEKGFKTWESFSAVVLCFYPEVGITRLKLFWEGKSITPTVLIAVENVKLIISPINV